MTNGYFHDGPSNNNNVIFGGLGGKVKKAKNSGGAGVGAPLGTPNNVPGTGGNQPPPDPNAPPPDPNAPGYTPPVIAPNGTAQIVPGLPQMSQPLDQAAWTSAIGEMPPGGWTLSDGTKTKDAKKAYEDYANNFQGTPLDPNQINVADYAGQVVTDPTKALRRDDPNTPENESMFLSDRLGSMDPDTPGTNIDPNDPRYAQQGGVDMEAAQAQTQQAQQVDPRQAVGYDPAQTADQIAQNQIEGAQGQISDQAQVQHQDIDMQGMATGVNADGSINYTGQALAEAAIQNLDDVDDRATVKGQIAELQEDFTGPNGEPKIPLWAQGTAREISKIAAFKGMSGSAATAAMAQALMEASIPIAQQDAQFFQTLTLQNLSNRQQSTINRANVLAKMDELNADNRLAAAIQNSKNFLEMDLRNLDNEQQARVINNQNYVQSILEDAKAVNTARLFEAESQNEMNRFYDNLSAQISQFNASQANAMSQFNASEANSMSKYVQDLENQREQFYKSMQYNIDMANAQWRQTITLTENEQAFEAAATDVKNLVGISVEQLNQLWDRSDSLLDYLWQSTENELDRNAALVLANKQAKAASKAADKAGWGSVFGAIGGVAAGKVLDKILW